MLLGLPLTCQRSMLTHRAINRDKTATDDDIKLDVCALWGQVLREAKGTWPGEVDLHPAISPLFILTSGHHVLVEVVSVMSAYVQYIEFPSRIRMDGSGNLMLSWHHGCGLLACVFGRGA